MTHRVDELPDVEFLAAAEFAARDLADKGSAWVDLQPGDATTYKIAIIVTNSMRFWVGTSFGPLYEWRPDSHYDCGYVADKWTEPRHEWTARVICRFLNTLSDKMKEASDGRATG